MVRRHQVHPASQQKAFKTAVEKACITKNAVVRAESTRVDKSMATLWGWKS